MADDVRTVSSTDEMVREHLEHSRTRYADLYDFSPIGYANLDATAKIEDINLAGGSLLGENPNRLVGRQLTDFIVADDVERFHEYLDACRKTSTRLSIQVRMKGASPRELNVELFTIATQDANRHTLQFRTAMLNITERKEAEEALWRSHLELERRVEERTRQLNTERLQHETAQRFLNEASVLLSASLDYGTTLASITRLSVPQVADCCMVDIVQPDLCVRREAVTHKDPEKEHLLWSLDGYIEPDLMFGRAKVIRTGRSELYSNITPDFERTIARNAAHLRILRQLAVRSYMCVPIKVRGRITGSIGFLRSADSIPYTPADLALAEELADRAAMALDNAKLYLREQEANRLKDDFLARVSHELRTPLTPILGAIYMMRMRQGGNNDADSSLDIIERNAKRQAQIVEDLLDISRIAAGTLELHKRPTDIFRTIESSISLVRPAAEMLGIRFESSLERPTQTVNCDPDRIQQAVSNVLSNAVKFTPPGGRIEVRLEGRPSGVRITISDTGIGIPPHFIPHVFDRFRQADRFTTRAHGGLGLGLSIVRHIVERHGGSVRASSAGEGKGASFVIDLPYS